MVILQCDELYTFPLWFKAYAHKMPEPVIEIIKDVVKTENFLSDSSLLFNVYGKLIRYKLVNYEINAHSPRAKFINVTGSETMECVHTLWEKLKPLIVLSSKAFAWAIFYNCEREFRKELQLVGASDIHNEFMEELRNTVDVFRGLIVMERF